MILVVRVEVVLPVGRNSATKTSANKQNDE